VVKNVPASVAHYRDTLGFEVAFTWGDPVTFAGVCRDDVTIHLQADDQTRRPAGGGAVSIFVDDADRLYAELTERGATIPIEPKTYPYGMHEFSAFDPDGNQLTYGHAVGEDEA
jgi:uncharacterized glyoxalase superfamily protein PhnB